MKINFARHQHDTESRTQNRAGLSGHRQMFRYNCSSSVWRNNQRKLWWKISAHSDLSPDLELSTPAESRHITCLLRGKTNLHCSILLLEFNTSIYVQDNTTLKRSNFLNHVNNVLIVSCEHWVECPSNWNKRKEVRGFLQNITYWIWTRLILQNPVFLPSGF